MARPNILIIVADDIGVDAFRVDEVAKTVTARVDGPTPERSAGPAFLPTFERMLRSGVCFGQAWAHPVCTPTRASLWTGVQPWKTSLGYPLGGDLLPTNRNLVSLAQALRAGGSGYRCAMFGKWDLGGVRDPADPAKDQNPVKTWGWDQIIADSDHDGRIEAFAIGMDDVVCHTRQTTPSSDAWGGWSTLPGKTVKRIASARNADGRLTVFAIGFDDAIWTASQTAPSGGWGSWQSLGGKAFHLTVETHADGRLQLFAIASDGAVRTAAQVGPSSDAWSPWTGLDETGDAPAASRGFRPAGTRWAVGVMDDNGTVSGPHPTPWEFGAGTMQAAGHWTGTYTPIPGHPDAYACRITMTSGGAVDEFETRFVSPTRLVCTKNGALYRFGTKV